jgi:tetratricopeptide (TPR) repeat protein
MKFAWIPFALSAIVVWLYWDIGSFDFVNYDDNAYFYENPHVTEGLSWTNARWAFEIHGPSMWIPLTWLSHQAAVSAFGTEPGAHHWINVALHVLNIWLLFQVLCRYTGKVYRCAFITALFALHPIHVESVAWITERKDVLAMAFLLAGLWVYHSYSRTGSRRQFVFVMALHACAVMAKPLAVTVPCLLLLLDAWPLQRISSLRTTARLAVEKIPLLLISAFASWMTILCQLSINAIASTETLPIGERLINVLVNYAAYLRKLVAPIDLVPFYPQAVERDWSLVLLSGWLLLAVTALCWICLRQRKYAPLIGWLWYLGTLVPMIGLVQAGSHAMADRYAYLPFIGIYLLIVWIAAEIVQRLHISPKITTSVCLVCLFSLALLTHGQIQIWRNSETLFQHTISVSNNNFLAHNNLGLALKERGAHAAAKWHFNRSLQIKPDYSLALNNLAIVAAGAQQYADAESYLLRATSINPEYANAFHNLAKVYAARQQLPQAIAAFERALQIDPNYVEALYDLGCLYLSAQQPSQAVSAFERTLELAPRHVNALTNLGVAFSQLQQNDQARKHYQRALQVDPGNALVRANLESLDSTRKRTPAELSTQAIAMRERGNYEASLRLYLQAVEASPKDADLQNDAGVAFGLLKEHELALIYFQEAIRLNPDHRLARQNKAAAEAALIQANRME